MIFKDPKKGDVIAAFYDNGIFREIITDITDTTIIADGTHSFMRENGSRHKPFLYMAKAEPWTHKHDEMLKAQEANYLHTQMITYLDHFRWASLNLEQLKPIMAIVKSLAIEEDKE